MNLGDPSDLYHCKPENLERLARALGAPLPAPGPRYEVRLRRVVANAILADLTAAKAEERREMDRADSLKVAMEIAATVGENGVRPIAQIRRIVRLMGAEWTRERLTEAWAALGTDVDRRRDGATRTVGGTFFEVCRRTATGLVKDGAIARRDFFRCFTDRPAKPRQAPVKPAPKGKERVSQLDAGRNSFRARDKRKPAAPVVEYVASRRRSG